MHEKHDIIIFKSLKNGALNLKKLSSSEELKDILKSRKNVVLYIGSQTCSVCRDLLPKLESLEKIYEQIGFYSMEYSENREVMGQLSIHTVPAIVAYMEGKEYLREARFISIEDIRAKIDRYYNFMGDD